MKKIIKHFLEKHKTLAFFLLKYTFKLQAKMYSLTTVFAECYIGNGRHPKHEIIKYREWFAERLQDDWNVLDIGSHNGHMVEFMAGSCRFAYGIEISEELVREAKVKRMRPNVEYICADAISYDYSGLQRIDCVNLSNVLEHIEDRVDFLQNLIQKVPWNNKEMKRFFIRVPLIERDWIPVFMKRLGLDHRLDRTHFTEYTVDGFYNEMERASLVVDQHHVRFGELLAVCLADLNPSTGEQPAGLL